MKHRLFVFIFCTIIAPQIAEAQYSFTISHYTTGNCNIGGYNFDSYWRALGSRWPDGGYFGPFNTLSSCESARQYILTIPDTYNINTGSCRIHYGATPCTGFSVGSVDYGNSNDIILGVSKGRSFYSPNSLEQILNWEKDDEQRQKALNYDYETYTEAQYINTGNENFNKEREKERNGWYLDTDKPFRSLNIDEKGGINTHSRDLGPISLKDEFDKVAMAQDFSSMANKENVERYVDFCNNLHLADLFTNLDHPFEGDLTMLLHQKFKDASGFDVDAIMQKLPSERTEAEKQALIDYQEFRKQVTENIIEEINNKIDSKKEFKMAVLASDSYKYSTNNFIEELGYQKIDYKSLDDTNPIKTFAEIIYYANESNYETGFHANLYYDATSNEYTISFEGSNLEPGKSIWDAVKHLSLGPIKDIYNDWVKTNAVQALGGIPDQYVLAAMIGYSIPKNIKVNITGHSLGGGLASIAGAISGAPTYTYNAEGVNKNIISSFNLEEKVRMKDFQIKSIRSDDDPLTSAQEGSIRINSIETINNTSEILKKANKIYDENITYYSNENSIINNSAKEVNIIANSGIKKTKKTLDNLSSGLENNDLGAPALGEKKEITTGEGHSIDGLIIALSYTDKTYDAIKNNIYEKGHHVEYQTQETILIYTGE